MAISSTLLPLGTNLPPFRLLDVVRNGTVDSTHLDGPTGTLVMFICNHCPYVVHVRSELVKLAHEAQDAKFAVLAINSNSVQTHPQDGPSFMKTLAIEEGWRFPFLFDESQQVAQAFQAACTPDLYLFDGQRKLVYRGQLDDARPGNGKPVTGRDLRGAIQTVVQGGVPSPEQRASVGCGIKWHPGREPAFLRATT